MPLDPTTLEQLVGFYAKRAPTAVPDVARAAAVTVTGVDASTDPATAWHPVVIEAGAPAELFGMIDPDANSTHHQAVDSLGAFLVLARAPDGIVEAMYRPGAAFCVGVQGHPELRGDRLFRGLVAAAGGQGARVR